MPRLARKHQYYNGPSRLSTIHSRLYPQPRIVTPVRSKPRRVKKKKVLRKKKINHFANFISLILLCLIGYFVLPYGFNRISKPLFFGPSYQEVKVDYNELLNPTLNYLSNDLFLNRRLLLYAETKKPEMTPLYITQEMIGLESKLQRLMLKYKTIEPSIFVWDYETGKYADIKASKHYAAASIIKIPVLIQLFKSIEANQLTIYDEMNMTPYFLSEGSGDLQFKGVDAKYTIDELARAMITKSDNSATNMIMSKIGSMTDVNSGIRDWGLKNTYINNWLPDMAGTNYTTTRDLVTMLYNLDNPGFLNINSREYIIDYMSHVENNRLIQAGLDSKALFVHKTGDIGKMLGDAGIVYTPSGRKYIVAILANRPYNSYQGKEFIQKASSIIYKSIVSRTY